MNEKKVELKQHSCTEEVVRCKVFLLFPLTYLNTLFKKKMPKTNLQNQTNSHKFKKFFP